MVLTIIELKKLIADEGKVLTNGTTFGKLITLGITDNESNWYEITEEEYAEILAEAESEEV